MTAPAIRTRLSQRTLKELLDYDQKTGRFTWKTARGGKVPAGSEAGHVRPQDRQRVIVINGRAYAANRLAWLYMTGDFPTGRLTYADRDPTNLAWKNIEPEAAFYSTTKHAAYQRELRRRKRMLRAMNEGK